MVSTSVRITAALAKQEEARRQQQLMSTLQSVVGELGVRAKAPEPTPTENWQVVGDLQISSWNQTVRRGEQTLNLTPTEFRILACLAQQTGQVMT